MLSLTVFLTINRDSIFKTKVKCYTFQTNYFFTKKEVRVKIMAINPYDYCSRLTLHLHTLNVTLV